MIKNPFLSLLNLESIYDLLNLLISPTNLYSMNAVDRRLSVIDGGGCVPDNQSRRSTILSVNSLKTINRIRVLSYLCVPP